MYNLIFNSLAGVFRILFDDLQCMLCSVAIKPQFESNPHENPLTCKTRPPFQHYAEESVCGTVVSFPDPAFKLDKGLAHFARNLGLADSALPEIWRTNQIPFTC